MSATPERAPAEGTLRVQVLASLGRLLIAPALPRFIHQHPGLRVHISEAHASGEKLPRHADAAVCVGSVADSTLIAQRIGTISTVTCAAPEFIEQHGVPATPMQLAPTHCIGLFEPGRQSAREWVFTQGRLKYSVSPAAPLAFSDADSAVAAAVRGAGYVQVLCAEAERQIASGLLRPALEDWNAGHWPVSIVHARYRVPSEDVLAFGAFVAGLLPWV